VTAAGTGSSGTGGRDDARATSGSDARAARPPPADSKTPARVAGASPSAGDVRTTSSGVEKKPVYGPGDAPADPGAALGEPGAFPYTRGIHPLMYRSRLWTMRQYAGMGTAAETNARFRRLLDKGQTGLSVAFDLPTQMGLDSDDPRALGEVGRVGVAIDSVRDVEALFDGIPLAGVSVSMTINAPAAVLVAMLVVAAERQGVPAGAVRGTVQNDILKEYVARGAYVLPPRAGLRLACDLIAWCAREAPRFNAISVSGYHIRDAGSTAVQEMAFALCNAFAYVEETARRGVAVDDFAPRISWIFNTHNDFFEEVCKYRALRRLWAREMRERFGASGKSLLLRTHTQTGGVTLQARRPENNVVRAAYQALAAVLGGVQSMALSCKDEALAIPTDEAQETALRTQQILAHETGVVDVVDPLGGSFYVEALTDELERRARALIEEVDARGGPVAAIESGSMQRAIARAAWDEQRRIESGEQVVVGVNAFGSEREDRATPLFGTREGMEDEVRARLGRHRDERDAQAAASACARLTEAAREPGAELMAPIVEAVRAQATVGEIMAALETVFGRWRAPAVV